MVKARTNIVAGVLTTLTLLTSAVSAEQDTQAQTANLLPNASFEKKAIEGVEGWTARAWHGKEDAEWRVGSRAYNDIAHPNWVAPKEVKLTFKSGVANLPAHSLTIVHVPAVAGN